MTTLLPQLRRRLTSPSPGTAAARPNLPGRTASGCLAIASALVSALVWALVWALACASAPSAGAQTSSTSQPVIVADLNHDGIPDALVLSTTTPTATIAFGSVPYGSFSGASKAVTFPAGCSSISPSSIAVGDFNGDGFPDIAFVCPSVAGVMLGNGDGTFGAANTLSGVAGGTPLLGDFNHDGKLDLAVFIAPSGTFSGPYGLSQYIQFLAGNGDGTFAEPVLTTISGSSYSSPVVADVNADGYPDIVLGSFNTDSDVTPSINVFGNNQNGTFGIIAQGYSTPNVSANLANATQVSTILTGNFFGAGAADFVVPDTGSVPGFFVIQNTSSGSVFSLGTPATIPYAGLTGAMAGGFTGSGFTDLAAANGTSIAVLANDGTGTGNFTPAYSTLSFTSTSSTFAVADANGDGYADIYTAAVSQTGAMQLAVNLTTGTATATSQPVSLPIGTQNISAAWNGNINFTGSTATGTEVVLGVPTTTTVVSSKNPSFTGDSVTFTATITSAPTENVPTGTVTITADGTTVLGSGMLDDSNTFAVTTSTLNQATHSIVATYSGDSFFAGSTSTVLSQVVNHPPAVPSNLTWATPAAIVYGTALGAAQLDATAVDATGNPIPGTFVYSPAIGAVLGAGVQTLSVTFTPNDLLSFEVAKTTVSLTVTQATPVLTWANPASIAYGIPLSATQLDAAVAGVTGAALAGTFTYNPASGTVLNPGTQTLSVSFAPTDAVDYTTATGSVKITITGLTEASFTPTSATLGAGATTITVTGSGFVSTSVVLVNGTAIPTTLVNPTTLTAIIPASDLLTVGTLQISVSDPSVSLMTLGSPFTVVAPPPAASLSAPPTTAPGTQPTLAFTVTQPYPVDLSVTLSLAFVSSTTPRLTTNQQLQLACQAGTITCTLSDNNATVSFVVKAGTTDVPVVLLQAGTIAGTITVPITLMAGGANVTPSTLAPATIVVPPAVPAITAGSLALTRAGNQLTVVLKGFSNTREMVSADFHFTAAPGASLATTDLTLPATAIFNDWYSTAESDAYGSTFTYTQVFTTSDPAATIGSVEVTLTNTVGVSVSATAQ